MRIHDRQQLGADHLICRACGRIEDFDAPVDTAAAERKARRAGFRVDQRQLAMTGLCAQCLR